MKFYVNRRILGGLFVSMIIISSLGLGSFLFIREMISVSRQSLHTQQVLFISERIRALHHEAQAVALEYASTGAEDLPNVFAKSRKKIDGHVLELDSLTALNLSQQENIREMRRILDERKQLADITRSVGKVNYESLSGVLFSKSDRDRLSVILSKIQNEEKILRKNQQSAVTKQFYQFGITFIGLLLAGLVTPLGLALVLNQNLKDRTAAEEKLKEASNTIYDLYQKAPCGYFSVDKQGMFTNVNETLLTWLGYTREQVVDRLHFTDVITPKAADVYSKDFDQLKERGFIVDVESRIVRKDKSILPVLINATAIMDANNNYLSSRCTLYDITERKKAEAETRRLNAELEAFSYSVSHDLRAPLRSVNGFAKILREDYGGNLDEEGNRVIGKIVNNATRMGQLIDDLLDFSRIGKKEINKTEINTREFVELISRELIDQEKEREIEMDIKSLENCNADPSMIRQVWINLISNALKYSRNQKVTRIEIGSESHPEEIVFYIKDNGVGFDMKFMDKLFGVFQRLHRMEDFEGTGVGLALVKRIIERHHGRIWANARLNEGASFYFTFPRT